jgi:gamma-glutamyl hercynylcysteine S-oxide synthase
MLSTAIDTRSAVEQYRRNRARTETLFDLIAPDAYYTRPIALRNPIVFYEGHLPAFSVIAFLRRGLGLPPVDARLEKLFERGIDPDSTDSAVPRSGASTIWPSRDDVRAFARACDAAILAAIPNMPATPEAIEGLYTALEHEAMHQETLLYMWHRLAYEQKRRPTPEVRRPTSISGQRRDSDRTADVGRRTSTPTSVPVPTGEAVLGVDRSQIPFGWDNEFDRHTVHVEGFDVDVLPVTNAQFREFIADNGYGRRDLWSDEGWTWIHSDRVSHPAFWEGSPGEYRWRGMFEALSLPLNWPVYVSQAEASAYAAWKGRRLMTEPEFHRAAEGATPGHVDFAGYDPIPVGSHPLTASRWGVHDLIGNGWEWTSTVFAPFAGFTPMRSYPEYSADFFDGRHFVMKGGSPATAIELTRPSFRNWFRGNYPYVYAKFRTVGTAEK